MAHGQPLRFRNFGGIHQFVVSDAADLAVIDSIDPARWAATSAPLSDLHCDAAFLAALDPEGTGRIRVSQLVAARNFLFERLARRDGVKARSETLVLADLDTSKEAGQKLAAAAQHVIKEQNLADATKVPLADVRAFRAGVAKSLANGDGIVPPDVIPEAEVAQLIKDIVATTGGAKDASGADGTGQAELDKFIERSKVYLEWKGKGRSDAIMVWGADTEAAAALVAGLDAKIEEFFLHCDLLRQEGVQAIALKEEELRALRVKDGAAIEKYLSESPIATPSPTGVLALGGPTSTGTMALGGGAVINAVYRDRFEELRGKVLVKALGAGGNDLTRASWRKVKAIFDAFGAWQKDKPAEPFDALGEDKVKALIEGPLPARIVHFIGVDKAAADGIAQIADLEKLVLLQRWLVDLVNNFVNFSSVYRPDAVALVERGSLVIDGRRLDFCLKVLDRGGHKKLATESLIYLVYANVIAKEGAAPAFEIVAPVTAGERGRLRAGKRGIFIDLDGKEWDAVVTEIVENPISVVEAMFAPFRKVSQLVTKKIEDWIGSAQSSQEKALQEQAEKAAEQAKKDAEQAAKDAEQAAKDAADGKAPPPKKLEPKKEPGKGLDVNSLILGGGIALAGLSSVLAAVFGLFTSVKGILAVAGLVAGVLALSALVGWLKLRKRDMGLLFEASGWAMNISMKINRQIGRVFTFTPDLPPGSIKERFDVLETAEDRGARRRRNLWIVLLVIVVLAAVYLKLWGFALPPFVQAKLNG